MKFAIGPAATIGGALADRLVVEAAVALLGRHGGERLRRRRRRLAVVAEELDVAAERNRGDLPARAMPVVEAGELRPNPSEKVSTFTPAQRATRKWPSS